MKVLASNRPRRNLGGTHQIPRAPAVKENSSVRVYYKGEDARSASRRRIFEAVAVRQARLPTLAVEGLAAPVLPERMGERRLLVQLDAETGTVRHHDLPVHDPRPAGHHLVDPRRLGDEELLDQEVRDH